MLDEEPEGSAAPIDAAGELRSEAKHRASSALILRTVPLAEQKAIVQEIKERNDAADYWARALMLVLLGGVAFL